jgi:hypothetical protein
VGGNKLESLGECDRIFLPNVKIIFMVYRYVRTAIFSKSMNPRHPISISIGYPVVGDLINYGLDVRF